MIFLCFPVGRMFQGRRQRFGNNIDFKMLPNICLMSFTKNQILPRFIKFNHQCDKDKKQFTTKLSQKFDNTKFYFPISTSIYHLDFNHFPLKP